MKQAMAAWLLHAYASGPPSKGTATILDISGCGNLATQLPGSYTEARTARGAPMDT